MQGSNDRINNRAGEQDRERGKKGQPAGQRDIARNTGTGSKTERKREGQGAGQKDTWKKRDREQEDR